MKNYKVKVTAASGTTPASATVTERTYGQAVGDALTTLISDDEGTVGYVGNAVRAGLVYGGMVYAKYRQVGQVSWNPF
jgi:hypothetical protein